MVETTDTLVVGGGQAGIAMSEHLGRAGVPHLVLERARIAEAWRSGRWDSLVMNGPAWHDRFPGLEFPGDPARFPGKEEVAEYFAAYAAMIDAPVRCGVEVTRVTRNAGRAGFTAETSAGPVEAARIVAATGPFQKPVIPALVPEEAGVHQVHSAAYRNPGQLQDGAVLVVGAGSSGVQIADELRRAGRRVHLSVGPHDRPPRAYRGRDFVWWLGVLGKWEAPPPSAGAEHVTISVSGARGGHTVDFRRLAGEGVTLVGRTEACADGALHFAPDIAETVARGDANYLSVLDEADAWAARNAMALPEEPEARVLGPDPDCLTDPVRSLALSDLGAVVWATGYAADHGWLEVDAFDERGRPAHVRGVSTEPGVYFLGLPWLSQRGSSFIWGVWHDARHIADRIAIQRGYMDQPNAARPGVATLPEERRA